ncbi:MAG TPA: aldehyde dehydrogenase family protein [Saprospiraceae bacterium]|nr:aldehyde dehydrogenase family protein [Saprospiraceae bacterium]
MDLQFIQNLGLKSLNHGSWIGSDSYGTDKRIMSYSPVDGKLIAEVTETDFGQLNQTIQAAHEAFLIWRTVPAPKRGELVRQFGEALRAKKSELGQLVSYEMGKSLQEGLGEVQEMIDICEFAVGMSRQLHGLTMHSERPQHRMYEQWHPLGVVAVISAFNFPVAVWSWNAALAWICGNTVVWKGSEKTPLCAVACQRIIAEIIDKNNFPKGLSCIVTGDIHIGKELVDHKNIPLISATGSTRMGREVAKKAAERFAKTILELGGNNAIIITASAKLKQVLPAIVFGAIGTAGQRCTSTRRLIIHDSIYEEVKTILINAYKQLRIGNPLDQQNHMGPLIDEQAVKQYLEAIDQVEKEGGKVVVQGGKLSGPGYESGCYVSPSIVEAEPHFQMVQHETFAPLLYLLRYSSLEEALAIQNQVPQGLSSAIMTEQLREAEYFLSAAGSDCGIANVNIGTSGAEIGGAFGGEKETGGGRESGSDAWKAYMRRQTNTISYSESLTLAQGIKFDF